MTILKTLSSLMPTKGRKIQIKSGLNKDFNDSVLDVAEFGLILDKNELRIGLADGTTMVVNGDSSAESQLGTHSELVASTVTLGHVKVGNNINVSNGVISIADSTVATKGVVQLADNLTTNDSTKALTAKQGYQLKQIIDNLELSGGSGGITLADIPDASASTKGLMTQAHAVKLNGISAGANLVTVVDNLTSTSSTSALSAYQGKVINDKLVDATTSRKGLVQLSDSTSSTSKSVAATANAVKKAYDLANTANNKTSSDVYQSSITKDSTSNAFGLNTSATGIFSTAMGTNSVASGVTSFAIGRGAIASGDFSSSIGESTRASGKYALATGTATVASGECSTATGIVTNAKDYASFALGISNKAMSGSMHSFSSNNTALALGNGTAPSPSNAFRVMFNGSTYGQGAFNSTGADYAEYFEWQDSNPDNEDRVGHFVTLNGEKIEIANSNSDCIIGIVSANPSVIGDSYQDQWQGMYVTDEWGRIQNEYIDVEYEELDEEGNKIVKTRQDYVHKLNPNYNVESEYIPREKRKEWSPVGMLGKLLVRDDGTCEVNGYAKVADGGIATKSDTGYRVIKRINENIVQIIFK